MGAFIFDLAIGGQCRSARQVFIPEVQGIIFLNWAVRYRMEKLPDSPVYLMIHIKRGQLEKKRKIRYSCVVKVTNDIYKEHFQQPSSRRSQEMWQDELNITHILHTLNTTLQFGMYYYLGMNGIFFTLYKITYLNYTINIKLKILYKRSNRVLMSNLSRTLVKLLYIMSPNVFPLLPLVCLHRVFQCLP